MPVLITENWPQQWSPLALVKAPLANPSSRALAAVSVQPHIMSCHIGSVGCPMRMTMILPLQSVSTQGVLRPSQQLCGGELKGEAHMPSQSSRSYPSPSSFSSIKISGWLVDDSWTPMYAALAWERYLVLKSVLMAVRHPYFFNNKLLILYSINTNAGAVQSLPFSCIFFSACFLPHIFFLKALQWVALIDPDVVWGKLWHMAAGGTDSRASGRMSLSSGNSSNGDGSIDTVDLHLLFCCPHFLITWAPLAGPVGAWGQCWGLFLYERIHYLAHTPCTVYQI